MEEAVLERIRKDETDEQWNKYHETVNEAQKAKEEPIERQKTYILGLAKTIGLKMDVSNIEDTEKAARIIEVLNLLKRRMK